MVGEEERKKEEKRVGKEGGVVGDVFMRRWLPAAACLAMMIGEFLLGIKAGSSYRAGVSACGYYVLYAVECGASQHYAEQGYQPASAHLFI